MKRRIWACLAVDVEGVSVGMARARGRDVRGAWWVRMGAGGGLPRLCAPELCCRVGCGYGEKDLLGLGLDRD